MEEERRIYDRRIEDVETDVKHVAENLRLHLIEADRMNSNIERMLSILEDFDTKTLEAIGDMIKGGRVMSQLTISISKFLIAIGIVLGGLITFFKFIIK